MTRPTRETVAGRAYLDLRKKAGQLRRPTDELLQLFVLEAFLERLAQSELADRLVLKGGVLLAAFDTRRPTRDVDLQAHGIDGSEEAVLSMVKELTRIEIDDGVVFDSDEATSEVIREEENDNGLRVSIHARLSTAQLPFHVDVNLGDPMDPPPQSIDVPRVLGGSIRLRGYPLSLVHAEKLVTAVARGQTSTRWRDFLDEHRLSRTQPANGTELTDAIAHVADHRGVELEPLATALEGFGELGQAKWAAWRRQRRLEGMAPESFQETLDGVIEFADPAIQGRVRNHHWKPDILEWIAI